MFEFAREYAGALRHLAEVLRRATVCRGGMVWGLVLCCLLTTLIGIAPRGLAYWNGQRGVPVKPGAELAPRDIVSFCQNDSRWADDSLGRSPFKLGYSGCLVCCIATVLVHEGYETTPKEFNELLGSQGGYNDEGEIIWGTLQDAVPGVRYEYRRLFGSKTIDAALARGSLPIVKVRLWGTGVWHWVVIVGASRDDFLVMDPLIRTGEIQPLSVHGGKAYSYRLVVRRNKPVARQN